MAIPLKTDKHSRTFYFNNGDALLVQHIVEIEFTEDAVAMTKSDTTVVIVYREKLNYCIIGAAKE